jgi:hypothetical protein
MSDQRIYVAQDRVDAAGEGTWMAAKGSKMGFQVVQDFYTQMAIEGRVYQVRAGTVTTHLTGDVEITDAKAEMCADAPTGTTIIPAYLNIHVEALGGTVPILAAKAVATASTAGTAFVPLPLKVGGAAATSTARVAAAGGVTVTAELATTTLRLFSATLATADMIFEWEPRTPPVLSDDKCFYVQVAGTTTGPNYYAHFDYIELPTTAVS